MRVCKMITEYTSCKLSCVRWGSKDVSGSLATTDRFLLGATCDLGSNNELRLYHLNNQQQDEAQLINCRSIPLTGVAADLITFRRDLAFSVCRDGSAQLITIAERSSTTASDHQHQQQQQQQSATFEMEITKCWKNLDRFAFTGVTYDKSTHNTIASGSEGKLTFFDLNSGSHRQTKKISQSSINCVESLNRNEIICGNETGDLKLFDIRTGNVELSLAQKLSALQCVRRHHSNGHIVCCGNDLGLLSIWDLRNGAENLQFISAHSFPITQLQYSTTETNSIVSSSLDGQLLKWNFSPDNKLLNVQCVYGSKNDICINAFDLSTSGRLAFFTDLEALNVLQI